MPDTREEFGDLLGLYDPVLIVIAAIIVTVVVFVLVRYRAREGRTPSTRREATVRESLYAATLAVIAAVLVAFTFRVNDRVVRLSDHPGLRLGVTAFKWQWRFEYSGQDVRPVV